MFLRKIKISLSKLILPIFFRLFKTLKINSRAVNFFERKQYIENSKIYHGTEIENILKGKKLKGLDVGAKGGFNSDEFFSKKYNQFFEKILVDPIKENLNDKNIKYINKGLWSSKCTKKLFILGNRDFSSSMYEPDKDSLEIYGFKKKDYKLFDVTKTTIVECDTIESTLNSLNIKTLDYLKIDAQGAELEILKGLGDFKPLLIKCEIQIYPMYKDVPNWTNLLGLLDNLNYMLCEWRKIGSHITHSPTEMDMVFIPKFNNADGKKQILNKQDEFIALMLMSGQIKLLKNISNSLELKYSETYMKIKDRFFF